MKNLKDLGTWLKGTNVSKKGFDFNFTTAKIGRANAVEVHCNGKRGSVADAERAAMDLTFKLPENVTIISDALHADGEEVSVASIARRNEEMDDREHTDSEFSGSILYKVKITKAPVAKVEKPIFHTMDGATEIKGSAKTAKKSNKSEQIFETKIGTVAKVKFVEEKDVDGRMMSYFEDIETGKVKRYWSDIVERYLTELK